MTEPEAGARTDASPGSRVSRETRVALYAARRYLPLKARRELGLGVPVVVHFKDPAYAPANGADPFDRELFVPWEPGLRDGPTSARFAVVDYDATTGTLESPALWDAQRSRYMSPDGKPLDDPEVAPAQFRQVSVWATIQHTLDFFESAPALGRRIGWGFEGNRLIVVPRAGYGQNAYYDRQSKSLQFYYFQGDAGEVSTCLSSDIVNHEFGHAVLDGLRPHYLEAVSPKTAAFHEFLGDLTALLMALRNNSFRRRILTESDGDLETDVLVSSLARQFGEAVTGQPYLRTARNDRTMSGVTDPLRPHDLSEVMTGTMFDIVKRLFATYRDRQKAAYAANPAARKPSDALAFWHTIDRMQMTAIQPLDFLPPCDVSFRDYALAVLRNEQVANPTDPTRYRELMLDVFIRRGILGESDRAALLKPTVVFDRPNLDVSHPVESIAASRGSAYRFLDDNREKLLIPANADLTIGELVRARKQTREGRALPDQIVLQYVWREEVALEGARFGRFSGRRTTMLCGATLVLDQNGNLIHWSRKAGSEDLGPSPRAQAERADGTLRRETFLGHLAARIAAGMVGDTLGGELGLLARASPPFTTREVEGSLRFELSPHFAIDDHEDHEPAGGRGWQISS